MSTRKHLFIFILILLFKPNFLWAESSLPILEIDKIVISFKPKARLIASESGSLNWDKKTPALPLADTINTLSGVSLSRQGGIESPAAVSIRGSQSGSVQFVLDGIPLETASGQSFHLEYLPSQSFSKIEIYKTFAPLKLGTFNSGGTLALTSKPIEPNTHQSLSFGLGSFGTREASGEISIGKPNHNLRLGLDYLTTSGDFKFLDNNGTPSNSADDQTTTRQNNDLTTWHPHLAIKGRPHPHFEIDFKTDLFSVDKGVAGFANFQSTHARVRQTESISRIKWSTTKQYSKDQEWSHQLYTRFILNEFNDPLGEIGLGSAQNTHDTTFILGNQLQFAHSLSKTLKWQHQMHHTYESFLPRSNLEALTGSQNIRHQIKLGTEPEFSFHQFSLTLQTQALWAYYDLHNDDPSLEADLDFTSHKSDFELLTALKAKQKWGKSFYTLASVSRDVRLPHFNELFGDQGYVKGNPELSSEKTIKAEGGILFQNENWGLVKNPRVELTYFSEWTRDLIQFEVTSGVASASNIGTTRTQGLETFFYASPFETLNTSVGYTFLLAKDSQTQRFLVGRPKHKAQLAIEKTWGPFTLLQNYEWIHEKYLDSLNLQKINARLRADASLFYTFAKKHKLSLDLKNFTNSTLEDALGYPLPGRSFHLRYSRFW